MVVFIRIRFLAIPLERDEGEYAYAGQLMLQGIPPYRLAYNMKFPGRLRCVRFDHVESSGESSVGHPPWPVGREHREHRDCFFDCEATDRFDSRHRRGGQLRDSLGQPVGNGTGGARDPLSLCCRPFSALSCC